MVQPTHISHVSPNVIPTPTPVSTPVGYHWGLSIHRKASPYVLDVNKYYLNTHEIDQQAEHKA